MSNHNWQCVCGGHGTIEGGSAGATYSVPCPGPPKTIHQFGQTYYHIGSEDDEKIARVLMIEMFGNQIDFSAEALRLARAVREALLR